MSSSGRIPDKEHSRKKKRIWWIIFIAVILMCGLTYLETKVVDLGTVEFPVSGNVLMYVLINFNIILLLLIVFLVLRNLVQLIFDRKRKVLGTRLRTKLVISFMSMALIPTGILFFMALQFVSTSMDYWFNSNVEQALQESVQIGRNIYKEKKEDAIRLGQTIGEQLEAKRYYQLTTTSLDLFLDDIVDSRGLGVLELITQDREVRVRVFSEELDPDMALPEITPAMIRKGFKGEERLVEIQKFAGGELVRNVALVNIGQGADAPHVLVTSLYIPREKLDQLHKISSGLEGYRQLMLLQQPIKTSLLVILLIVTLLIIFSAIWFGFYMAGGLTDPIGKLAEATKRVAGGELDFVIERESGDEMGTLVESFNKMTRDLYAGQRSLEQFNFELENRRRYTETILQNVPAGVISLDGLGRITSVNTFAENLLNIEAEGFLGHSYQDVLAPQHSMILDQFFDQLEQSGKSTLERSLQLSMGNETFSLRVNVTKLYDEKNEYIGVILVFDNLTELEKAQRMAAWREVARRIAHEVKNPLTPISLSAQRLRRRYMDKLGDDAEVFDLCTSTIVSQVDALKHLVSEFSNFARMPAIVKKEGDLVAMVHETVVIYVEAHPSVSFQVESDEDIPYFSFDKTQMNRVLINLLDNAVAVVPEQGGEIVITITKESHENRVFLKVEDNGPGVKDADKLHLFEPYYTTKKTGTGLGLSIVSTIVADHGGYIRIKDNEPQGASFVVELPFTV
jgi:two-component system nitrogen regulation sensor histidine kinase NtrY